MLYAKWFMPNLILIIENDTLLQEALADLFRFAGIKTLEAHNGRDAIATFRTHHKSIGLVLMDMRLHDMDGSQILPELEAIRPDISVIGTSGEDQRRLLRLFAGHGNVSVLSKPYDMNIILKQVQDVLKT